MRYSLAVRALHIPFRMTFKHASASRAQTAAVWVQARGPDGLTGYGEGCPRPYVTGETVEGAQRFIEAQCARIESDVTDLDALRRFVARERTRIDAQPAAWCAVELALLDLFARNAGMSVEHLLGLPELSGQCRYSAVLGDADADTFARQLARYRAAGFRDFKVKLSGDPRQDAARLAWFEANERVRVDANNLWPDADRAHAQLVALQAAIVAVEEPLQAGDIAGCRRLVERLGVPVVLDESFLREEQLPQLAADRANWILNIRVSKLGGLLRSLTVAQRARELGLPCVIGAQVGETSLLTRAALALIAPLGTGLFAQEGAFGTQLLERDVCVPPVMFGSGGVLDVGALGMRAGFGLRIQHEFA